MLINIKMPTFVGILIFVSMINFMLSKVEHEKVYDLEARLIVVPKRKVLK